MQEEDHFTPQRIRDQITSYLMRTDPIKTSYSKGYTGNTTTDTMIKYLQDLNDKQILKLHLQLKKDQQHHNLDNLKYPIPIKSQTSKNIQPQKIQIIIDDDQSGSQNQNMQNHKPNFQTKKYQIKQRVKASSKKIRKNAQKCQNTKNNLFKLLQKIQEQLSYYKN